MIYSTDFHRHYIIYSQLQERLNKILAVGGVNPHEGETAGLLEDDLDEEWDPVRHEVSISVNVCII